MLKLTWSFPSSLSRPDPSDPSTMFVTPIRIPSFEEGEDFLFRCLLTDPSVTNLTLQSVGGVGDGGRSLPEGMNVTFNPRRGVLIQQLQRTFNGQYFCSGWRDGRQFRSKPVLLELRGLSTCLTVYLSTSLTVCLPVCLSVCPSTCLSNCLPECLSICLSLSFLSTCLPVCLQGLPPCTSVRMSLSFFKEKGLRLPV